MAVDPSRRRLLGGAAAIVAAVALAGVVSIVSGSEPAQAMGAPQYVEEAAAAGLDHVYGGEFTFFVGGGVAVFDCDADRKPDVYLAGGENPASLYRNESLVAGELRFVVVEDEASQLDLVTGAYPLDVDGDDVLDLAVLRLGENVLLRGLGDCRFERANEDWGFDGGDVWTTAFSAKWEAGSDLPTLAFGNYLVLDEQERPAGGCTDNTLVRPDGARYGQPAPLAPGWCTLSVLFSDWDRSGDVDLRIANDRQYYRDGEEQLWRVQAGAEPQLYTRSDGWNRLQIFGMGIASHDVTGDGLPEVFLTSMGDNKLQTLSEGADRPSYSDIALDRGVTAHRPFTGDEVMPSTAWHAEFQDVNNDSFVDLFIAKGNVDAMVEAAGADPNNLLIGQGDGTFVESAEAAGLLNFSRARGAALADFNLDGLLDVIEVNRRENVKLWRNVGTGQDGSASAGHWLAVDLEQSGPNRDAIGAWVEVRLGERTLYREATVGGGHAGGQLTWMHFGIGSAPGAEVRVQWPGGEFGPWVAVDANTFVTIARDGEPTVWHPAGE